ncbi:MAG: hypothetical protein KZQ94_15990 [Candidatus Thiodiazotropha sp. (ex Troendleina suluensis)]|nr:hypothetical protein [Candidatus Thiodiazotropha sp. (ex Troendleina suluensis)]
MEEDSQEERRSLRTFRDKVVPSVVSVVIIAVAGGLMFIRDTVIEHDRDLMHFKKQCHNIEEKVSGYELLDHRVKELEIDVEVCNAQMDKLVGF